jgi:Second Messenger Oligonucleotide or Dinucleotide Synthetase domain
MANCQSLFQTYNNNISLTQSKKNRLKTSKEGLRNRVKAYFKEHHPEYKPKFYIQGSYKMRTAIRTKEDICDLDDGIYFFRNPDVTATVLQTWVKNAVDGYTDTSPEHLKKCIRNIFAGDYEIDMPIYYKIDGKDYQLAIKNIGWETSDSKAVVDWFNGKKEANGVLVKMVKYLKGWCDNKSSIMPNGLAMTILASNVKHKIVYNKDRDDLSLRDTLKEIKKNLDLKFACVLPVTPNDDLFGSYDEARKNNFMTALNDFIKDAETAVKETNQLKSSQLWKNHLGSRFPNGEDKNESATNVGGLYTLASSSRPFGY